MQIRLHSIGYLQIHLIVVFSLLLTHLQQLLQQLQRFDILLWKSHTSGDMRIFVILIVLTTSPYN